MSRTFHGFAFFEHQYFALSLLLLLLLRYAVNIRFVFLIKLSVNIYWVMFVIVYRLTLFKNYVVRAQSTK